MGAHHIRHSFSLRAPALGQGLPIIGRLLGHRRVETTARYAHLARDSPRESDGRIAVSIANYVLEEVGRSLLLPLATGDTIHVP